jgi:DNA-binding NtrC family response regulator
MEPFFTWSSPSEGCPCSSEGVLLIDDDRDFRTGLAENLRDDGHHVYEYSAPREVPPFSTLQRIRLVITDYQFADDDGVRFSDRVHDAEPTLPIVILTAYLGAPLDAAAARRAHLHLLHKHLSYDVLHAYMHRLMSTQGSPPRSVPPN